MCKSRVNKDDKMRPKTVIQSTRPESPIKGGHILAKMKFPVFSRVFHVLHKFSLCYINFPSVIFMRILTINLINKGHILSCTITYSNTQTNFLKCG